MRLSTWSTLALCVALTLLAPSVPPPGASLSSGWEAVHRTLGPAHPPVRRHPAPLPSSHPFPSLPKGEERPSFEDMKARTLEILQRNAHPSLAPSLEAVADSIVTAADRHDLDPELLLAMIHTESSFRPGVRSRAGAVGLMQLLPATARPIAEELEIPWSGSSTLLDPVANVRLGAWYLAHLRDDFDGDMQLAISAYNLGPSRVKRYLKKGKRPAWYAGKVEAAKRRLFRTEEAVRVSARNPAPSPNG